jgi:excisionase family DNA binding protein
MSTELEKLFSPDVLAALDERARRIAEEVNRSLGSAGCVKVKTACELLDMNESRVRQLIREGRLRVINPTPNTIRIPLSEIRRFTEEES